MPPHEPGSNTLRGKICLTRGKECVSSLRWSFGNKEEETEQVGTRGISLLFCLSFCRVLSPRRSCNPSASPQQEPAVDTEPQADLANLVGFAALPRSPQQDAQLTGRIRGGEG